MEIKVCILGSWGNLGFNKVFWTLGYVSLLGIRLCYSHLDVRVVSYSHYP